MGGVLDQRRAVIIFSADLSHLLPYEKANTADRKTIEALASLSADEFYEGMDADKYDTCGKGPLSVMKYLQELRNIEERPILLKYMNSGDTTVVRESVTGFASMALFERESLKKP